MQSIDAPLARFAHIFAGTLVAPMLSVIQAGFTRFDRANTIALPTGSFLLYTCERSFAQYVASYCSHVVTHCSHCPALVLVLALALAAPAQSV